MKKTVLFKAATLTVHQAGSADGYAPMARAILKAGPNTILLDAAAAEVLIGYLRVIRAYFTFAGRSRQPLNLLYQEVTNQLEKQLQADNRQLAEYADVTRLIAQLGCMHDWAKLQSGSLLKATTNLQEI